MSYYGGTVTVAGRNLITSLMAGKTIEFPTLIHDFFNEIFGWG